MRTAFLVRINSNVYGILKDWSEHRKQKDSFVLNTWLVESIEEAMRKEGIL